MYPFVFGLDGFLHWFPLPTMKGAAAEFMGGLVASGYFFPLLFGTYTITGAALLTGRFVPLALTVLAPVIVNIVAVHLFLAPSGFPLTILVVALALFLACRTARRFGRCCARVMTPRPPVEENAMIGRSYLYHWCGRECDDSGC